MNLYVKYRLSLLYLYAIHLIDTKEIMPEVGTNWVHTGIFAFGPLFIIYPKEYSGSQIETNLFVNHQFVFIFFFIDNRPISQFKRRGH